MDSPIANQPVLTGSMSDKSSVQTTAESNPKQFNVEEVTNIIKETVEATITDTVYSHTKVPEWNSTIVDNCLKRLKDMNSNFKYVAIQTKMKFSCFSVTCVIMQKNGAGFYAGSSVYWDNSHDGKAVNLRRSNVNHHNINIQFIVGSANYRFENKSLYAIVSVFGLSIN
ncbi:hypothetical protein INT44_005952 [Umbelopsis vinacea]|uniref:Uncharacterized protein n=1 Tax=Umbelopsis vinacea TaxID=44442 RepID=A0A8H7Q1H8_9FUNG|nr:hypothetical protein INT44_005952 [Umbelopsis vinacea]